MAFLISVLILSALAVSARWAWWRSAKPGLRVLCYHKIGDPPPGSRLKDLWVSRKKFRAQVKYLLDNGYTTVLFSDLKKAFEGKAALPENRPRAKKMNARDNAALAQYSVICHTPACAYFMLAAG